MLARFLFSLPRGPLGTRRLVDEPLSNKVRAAYEMMLEGLLIHTRGMHLDGRPFTTALHFDVEAQSLHDAFHDEVEPTLGDFGELAHTHG